MNGEVTLVDDCWRPWPQLRSRRQSVDQRLPVSNEEEAALKLPNHQLWFSWLPYSPSYPKLGSPPGTTWTLVCLKWFKKRKTANWSIAMQRADQLSTTTGVDFLFFEFRNCFACVHHAEKISCITHSATKSFVWFQSL